MTGRAALVRTGARAIGSTQMETAPTESSMNQHTRSQRGLAVGQGMAAGAAIGMILGLLLSSDLAIMVIAGVVAGMIVGAVVDGWSDRTTA